MKWIMTLFFLVLLGSGGYYAALHFTDAELPTFGLPVGSEHRDVKEHALSFWEDIKFKDIKATARFLAPDRQDLSEVTGFITRIFKTDTEVLDVVNYEISNLELDSTGSRARVKVKVEANNLATKESIDTEVMLFFHKSKRDNGWYLELSSSF